MWILHTEHKVLLNIITVSELKNTFTDTCSFWETWLCDYTVNRFTFTSNNLTQNILFKGTRQIIDYVLLSHFGFLTQMSVAWLIMASKVLIVGW